MQARLEQRLAELKAEFEAGQQMVGELEAKKVNLEQTLLGIRGAIQVLEELLAPAAAPAVNGAKPAVLVEGTVETTH